MIFRVKGNTLRCYGTIWTGDGTEFIDNLGRLESEYNDINIRLHTGGGDVFEGNLIYNAISKSNAHITLFVDGIAASMGGIILMACEDVKIVENGYVMLHAPSGYGSGQALDFEKKAKLLRLVERNFIDKLCERTGKTEKEVSSLFMIGDNWFSATEAKDMGLVSEVIPAEVKTLLPIDSPKNIGTMEAINLYASLITNIENSNNNNQKSKNMYEELIEALDLQDVTAQSSKTAVIDAVKGLVNGYKKRAEDAEKELTDYKDKEITSLVADAKEKEIINDEDVATYTKIGRNSGIEALRTVLGTKKEIPQAPSIANLLNGGGGLDDVIRADWDFDTWQEKDAKGLEIMADKEPEKFEKLLNAKYKK